MFSDSTPGRGLERLELRIERLKVTFRFTFAFHAREVRFECDEGEGFRRVFPETFSFHPSRHDPSELFLQLDDLRRKPRLLSPNANRRDSQELVIRFLAEAPRYIERVCADLEATGRLGEPSARIRVHGDTALLSSILLRFLETRETEERRSLRVAGYLLHKLSFRSLMALMQGRVESEYLDAYARGEVDPVDASDDPTESGFFHTLEGEDRDAINRIVVRMAERSFYLWLERICLEEENQAFEKDDSPFADRETEVLRAIVCDGEQEIQGGADLVAFLRRPTKDTQRVLKKLETWFLRQYDIRHSSAIIRHAANLERHEGASRRLLAHTPLLHSTALLALVAPFAAAATAYETAPMLFDAVCAAEVVVVNLVAVWFLAYRFCWKRDLTIFHASVPRIGAGIIVGYLPVFLIDEVWDLASQSAFVLTSVVTLLGLLTLLYIFVEVQRRLGQPTIAFRRARGLVLLGLVQAFAFGLVMTSLVGPFMVTRNWSPGGAELPLEVLRGSLDPVIGELPRVVGIEPIYAFPSAVLMMTFLSFFIGVFLQLMWEDLPITEPL